MKSGWAKTPDSNIEDLNIIDEEVEAVTIYKHNTPIKAYIFAPQLNGFFEVLATLDFLLGFPIHPSQFHQIARYYSPRPHRIFENFKFQLPPAQETHLLLHHSFQLLLIYKSLSPYPVINPPFHNGPGVSPSL